jgi:3-hydroxyisobutyrate dehydrogenase
MGAPVCANLVQAGYRVRAGDACPEAAALAGRLGAQWVPQLSRLAAGSDVLITILPGPGEVEEAMLGPGEMAEALRPGATWIDMTSNSPTAMAGIQRSLLARGVHVLEAPVARGVDAAEQGSLQLLVGGDAEVLARQRALLGAVGDPGQIIHVGGHGAGYTAKLIINLLWFGQAVATAEALLLGQAAGLDIGLLRETLTRSAADSQFIRHDLDALFAGDYLRNFSLDRCYQELQIITERARDLAVPFQLSETVADIYRAAVSRYGTADGELLGIALLEEQAGRQLRHPPAGLYGDFATSHPGPESRKGFDSDAMGSTAAISTVRASAGPGEEEGRWERTVTPFPAGPCCGAPA